MFQKLFLGHIHWLKSPAAVIHLQAFSIPKFKHQRLAPQLPHPTKKKKNHQRVCLKQNPNQPTGFHHFSKLAGLFWLRQYAKSYGVGLSILKMT